MENMNLAPYLLPRRRFGYRLGNGTLVDATVRDGLWCAFEDCHMGTHAERVAIHDRVSREDQDAFALASHQKAIAAIDAGRFAPSSRRSRSRREGPRDRRRRRRGPAARHRPRRSRA
jgi:acetyl-CoA C-acetyltransferase